MRVCWWKRCTRRRCFGPGTRHGASVAAAVRGTLTPEGTTFGEPARFSVTFPFCPGMAPGAAAGSDPTARRHGWGPSILRAMPPRDGSRTTPRCKTSCTWAAEPPAPYGLREPQRGTERTAAATSRCGAALRAAAPPRPPGTRGAPPAWRPLERRLRGAGVKEMSSAPPVLCSVSIPNVSSSPSPLPPPAPGLFLDLTGCTCARNALAEVQPCASAGNAESSLS